MTTKKVGVAERNGSRDKEESWECGLFEEEA